MWTELLKETLRISGPVLLAVALAVYVLKVVLERKFESTVRRLEEIGKTSLDVKKGLRQEEREELVALRVAVDKWEYFLQTAVIEFTMTDPAKADGRTLINKDTTLFQDVRVAIVRTSTYLRDRDLETKLMNAIVKIRKVYYPLINEVMPKLIDLQAQLQLIANKLQALQQSGMKDMAFAPTEDDRAENLKLQTIMTDEVSRFAQSFISEYRSNIAEQMVDLKEEINSYVYRPIRETDIDKE
ncbi:MAG: hypothetical protein DMG07_07810 [Acidobacteria bacterium]|nr:MAG: hypothetical protein DMG07_07810 [Acidobacteriota bacterium]